MACTRASVGKVSLVNYFGLQLLNNLLPSVVNYSLMGMYGMHSLRM